MIQLFPPPPPSGGVLFAPPLSAAGRPRRSRCALLPQCAPAPYGRGPPGCARRRLRRPSPWACLSVGSLRSPTLWYPKRTSRCSLARSFRPLRVLRLAVSATGGAQLRTPSVAPNFPIFGITPPARAYPCPPARTRAIRNFPRKFLLLFRRKFSFFGPPNLHPVH